MLKKFEFDNPTLLAALFITGQTVGASILALPVVLGLAGFFPALIVLILLWAMMLSSGLILVNQNTLHQPNTDLVSLYEQQLGPLAKYLIILGYLFLFYGFSVAYLSATTNTLMAFLPFTVPKKLVLFCVFAAFSFIILKSVRLVFRFNFLLMGFLLLAFVILMGYALQILNPAYLTFTKWDFLPATFSIALGSYGFHNTLPAVSKSLKGDLKKIRQAVFWGTSLPLVLNIALMFAICGAIPTHSGSGISLLKTFHADLPATIPLAQSSNIAFVSTIGLLFTLLAIVTSYLAVGVGLIGFVRDLLPRFIPKNKLIDFILVFLPPLCLVLIDAKLFLKAVGFSAGIGAALIFGILPACMLLKKRTIQARCFGVILLVLFLGVFMVEGAQQCGWIVFLPSANPLA